MILIAFTLVQTALQAGAKNGSWWDNFKTSFDKPFSGGGRGAFWENLIWNGMAMAVGFTPGMDWKTAGYLGTSLLGADLNDEIDRDGYNTNYLGFKAGHLKLALDIYQNTDRIYTGYKNYKLFIRNITHIPSYAR